MMILCIWYVAIHILKYAMCTSSRYSASTAVPIQHAGRIVTYWRVLFMFLLLAMVYCEVLEHTQSDLGLAHSRVYWRVQGSLFPLLVGVQRIECFQPTLSCFHHPKQMVLV